MHCPPQMQLQHMLIPDAAWPRASTASGAFVCLCPLVPWERAIFALCPSGRSEYASFLGRSWAGGAGPWLPVSGARGVSPEDREAGRQAGATRGRDVDERVAFFPKQLLAGGERVRLWDHSLSQRFPWRPRAQQN